MSAKLSDMAADEWVRAERALARAGNRWGRTARERSDEARKMAATLRSWAEGSRMSAGGLRQSASDWVAHTADWGGGSIQDGDRDKWVEKQGAMQAVADDETAIAERMLRSTVAAATVAAGDLERIASEAGRRTVAAATAAAADTAGSDELREAAAALKEGMAAAEQAANGL